MKKRNLIVTLVFIGIIFILAGFTLRNSQVYLKIKNNALATKQLKVIHVGAVADVSALILLADDQGFFAKNGLKVITEKYSSPNNAFNDLVSGKIDIAGTSEFPIVLSSFTNKDFKIIASVYDSTQSFKVVGRKDRGINKPTDLKGKRIGVTKNSVDEFFLETFLIANNLTLKDVEEVDIAPDLMDSAIKKDTIDAAITFVPYIYNIEKDLGSNATSFSGQSDQSVFGSLYAESSFIDNNKGAVESFVKSIVEAEDYSNKNKDMFKNFFVKKYDYSQDYVNYIVEGPSHINFRVLLNHEMLTIMEDEARWIINNKLTKEVKIPNFLNYIYFGALDSVNSKAIDILK